MKGSRASPTRWPPSSQETVYLAVTGSAHVVDAEGLVRDEHDHDVSLRAGAVLHDFAFGEPYKAAGSEATFVGDQGAFEHVHAVAAGVRVPRVDDASRVAHQAHQHACVGIAEQLLAKD